MLDRRSLISAALLWTVAAVPAAAFEKKAFDAKAFEAAKAAGKPILIDITASW
jgi:thioredoxin 1